MIQGRAVRTIRLLIFACLFCIVIFYQHEQMDAMRLKNEKLSADAEKFHRQFSK